MSNARVLELTCSLQYTLLHAYMAASPPMKLYFPRSKTAALPIYLKRQEHWHPTAEEQVQTTYANDPRCMYRNGCATSSSTAPLPIPRSFFSSVSVCLANFDNLEPRYLPCWEATWAVAGSAVILLPISCNSTASSFRLSLLSPSES
jgi:hypothetical protein